MTYAVLEQQLRQVDESNFDAVSAFLSSILSKQKKKNADVSVHKVIREPGILKGQIWMADDFDETPDCFKEYM